MELSPFIFTNDQENRMINFKNGNEGISLKFQKSPLKDVISVVAIPIHIDTSSAKSRNWEFDMKKKKTLGIHIEVNSSLPRFISKPFDYYEVLSDFIDVYWKNDVLRIKATYINGEYQIFFKQGIWEGYVSRINGKRIVVSSNEKYMNIQHDFSLSTATSKTVYELLQMDKHDEILALEKEMKKEKSLKRKEIVNRFLRFIGLQLAE